MKTYTVTEQSCVEGIRVRKKPYQYQHVLVGKQGHPNKWYAVHVEGLDEVDHRIFRAVPQRSTGKGTLILAREKQAQDGVSPLADTRALVLVDVATGPGGSTEWTAARVSSRVCPNQGGNGHEYVICPLCKTSYVNGRHPEDGSIQAYSQFPPPGISVLVKCATYYGRSKAEGGHKVALLLMEPGSVFRIRRIGAPDHTPAERFIRWSGEAISVGNEDEILRRMEGKSKRKSSGNRARL